MGADKTYQDYGFYADELNRFEANVDNVYRGTFNCTVGNRETFYDNQPFIDWRELNRLRRHAALYITIFRAGLTVGRSWPLR